MNHELFPLVRKFDISGAYDWRPAHPQHKNYGIHNMTMIFALCGAKGAVSITLETGWYLPAQQSNQVAHMINSEYYSYADLARPNIVDVGIHSKIPQHEGQSERAHCEYCNGPAYCDGTSLWGNEAWREGFLHGGTDWLWARLEEYYNHRFYGDPPPDLTPIPRTHPDDRKQS